MVQPVRQRRDPSRGGDGQDFTISEVTNQARSSGHHRFGPCQGQAADVDKIRGVREVQPGWGDPGLPYSQVDAARPPRFLERR